MSGVETLPRNVLLTRAVTKRKRQSGAGARTEGQEEWAVHRPGEAVLCERISLRIWRLGGGGESTTRRR